MNKIGEGDKEGRREGERNGEGWRWEKQGSEEVMWVGVRGKL